MDEKIATTIDNLKRRGFECVDLTSVEAIHTYIKELVTVGSVVGFGGSMTVEQLKIPAMLTDYGCDALHYTIREDYDYPTLCKMAVTAPYFITSSNALTVGGELVNIDGNANRIATIAYGPKTVILIVSHSKIVPDLSAAIDRVRNVVAPKNAKRLRKNSPCVISGKCEDCNGSDCICRATLILHHPTNGKKVHVILTPLELGY